MSNFLNRIQTRPPLKFWFSNFRPKSQKFTKKVKSLKIKLFWQKCLIFKNLEIRFDKNPEKFASTVINFEIKLFWQKSLKIKLFDKIFQRFRFSNILVENWAEKVKVWKSNFSNFRVHLLKSLQDSFGLADPVNLKIAKTGWFFVIFKALFRVSCATF